MRVLHALIAAMLVVPSVVAAHSLEAAIVPSSAKLKVVEYQGWTEIEVVSVDGKPASITLLSGHLTGAWCIPLNYRTRVQSLPGSGDLNASAYAETGIVGARVAVVPAQPDIRRILQQVVAASDLWKNRYGGPWALDYKPNFASYLMTERERITRRNVDAWISLCKATGVMQIDWVYCFRFGDYVPLPELYPGGWADVTYIVEKLRAAGIRSILHTYSFAIDRAAKQYRDPRTKAGPQAYRLPTDAALLDEIAGNLAAAIDLAGFDGVYFDALDWAAQIEGREWGWYWAGRFVHETGKRLKRPNLIVETAMFGAAIWPVASRYGSLDYKAPDWRTFVDQHVAALRPEYLLPPTLGWMPIDGTDDVEAISFLLNRAREAGAGISWRNLTPSTFAAHESIRQAAERLRAAAVSGP
jgi:hypothetical protein